MVPLFSLENKTLCASEVKRSVRFSFELFAISFCRNNDMLRNDCQTLCIFFFTFARLFFMFGFLFHSSQSDCLGLCRINSFTLVPINQTGEFGQLEKE